MNRRFLTLGEGAAVAAGALAMVLWLLLPKGAGAQAVVTRSGKEIGQYDLNAPTQVRVTGAHGLGLTVVIRDGSAYIEDAQCPDGICERHAPISRTGESIVCLPAQVVITVKGGVADGPDAVSG